MKPFLKTGFLCTILVAGFGALQAAPEKKSSTKFFRVLAQKKYASFGDAVKAISIFHEKDPGDRSYQEQLKFLKKKEIVPTSWEKEKGASLDRGEFAYMLVKALKINGGVITRLFGMTRRYAYKELTFRNIMASGGSSSLVHGEELLSVIRSATRYRNKHLKESSDE